MFRKSAAVPLVLMGGALLFLGYGCYAGWFDHMGRGPGGVGGRTRWFSRGPRVFVPAPVGTRRPTAPSSPRGGFGRTGITGVGA